MQQIMHDIFRSSEVNIPYIIATIICGAFSVMITRQFLKGEDVTEETLFMCLFGATIVGYVVGAIGRIAYWW